MESVVPQASCLHRELDKSRRDPGAHRDGTYAVLAIATEYRQGPSGVYAYP